MEVKPISIQDIQLDKNIQFIDVREDYEQPKVEAVPVTYIPLTELEHSLDKIDASKKKLFFCQSGIRCQQAVNLLNELDITNCFSLKEGASEINNYIKNSHY